MGKFFKKSILVLLAIILCVTSLSVSAAKKVDEIKRGTPTLDGEAEALWDKALEIAINFPLEGDETTNATGYARVMWDDDFLYCLGVIDDATPSLGLTQQNYADKHYWYTDAFEVMLDEAYLRFGDYNISQIRIDRKGNLSGMLQHVVQNADGIKAEYADTKWGVKDSATGWSVEVAIPWTRITPKADKTQIGLEFIIDDEKSGTGTLDGQMSSPCPTMWNPGNYRTLQLSSEKLSAGSTESENESSKDNSKDESSKDSSKDNSKDESSKDNSKDNSKNESSKDNSKDDSSKDNSKNESSKDETSEDNSKDDTSKEDSETTSKDDSPKDNSKNESSKDNSKNETSKDNSKNESSKDDSKDESEEDNAEDTDSKESADDEEDENTTVITVPAEDEFGFTEIMMIVLGAVIVLCLAAIVFVYFTVLRGSKKVKPKEEKIDE